MTGAVSNGIVLDTNIYYKNAKNMELWLEANGFVALFTPNNALELMTPNSQAKCEDLITRQQAVRNLLELTDEGRQSLPDTEVFHAVRLGFEPIDSGPWPEAAKRFLTISEFTPQACQAAGLNLQSALDARNTAYDQFAQKVRTCQSILQARWTEHKNEIKAAGGDYGTWRSPGFIRQMMDELGTKNGNIAAHVGRIYAVAEAMQLQGTLIDQSRYESAVGVYVQAYVGYLQYTLCTGRLDRNAFGDLQFFAYCDGGYRLVTSEKLWPDIAAQEGLEKHLVYLE